MVEVVCEEDNVDVRVEPLGRPQDKLGLGVPFVESVEHGLEIIGRRLAGPVEAGHFEDGHHNKPAVYEPIFDLVDVVHA